MKVKVRFEFEGDFSDSADYEIRCNIEEILLKLGLKWLQDEDRCDDGVWYEYSYEGENPYIEH